MTLDGLTMHFIINEIRETAVGCKVDKIHQPRPDTIILSLRAPGKNLRLLICAGASDSRIHMTTQKYPNPKVPPMFCMFLRKHITGAKIAAVQQIGLERIINLTLESKDELGLPHTLTLTAELMGKYSNVILTDEGGIIKESLRHVTQSISRVRSVLPSLRYELPQSVKLDPMTISRATLTELVAKTRRPQAACIPFSDTPGHLGPECRRDTLSLYATGFFFTAQRSNTSCRHDTGFFQRMQKTRRQRCICATESHSSLPLFHTTASTRTPSCRMKP